MTQCSSKRSCRSTVPNAAAAVTTELDASPWSSLHEDLIGLIGWRVLASDLLDYVRFRAMCTNWRSSTVPPAREAVASLTRASTRGDG